MTKIYLIAITLLLSIQIQAQTFQEYIKSGEIWPLTVGAGEAYQVVGKDDQDNSWTTTRRCEVDGTVLVTVQGNRVPVVEADQATTDFATPVVIAVLENDSDPDGDSLNLIAVTANNGAVQINGDNTLTYTPASGFSGNDALVYRVSDNIAVSEGQVTVTVAQNQAPIALDDTSSTAFNTPVTIAVLNNDSDPEQQSLTLVSATASAGTVSINGDQSLTYSPGDTVEVAIAGLGELRNPVVAAR